MKTRWELYCELRNFDNWCLRNPSKANLLRIICSTLIVALSLLLAHLPGEILLALVFGSWLWFMFARGGD
jgi:hypothetical protein